MAPQNSQLVAKRKNLQLLRPTRLSQQPHQREQVAHDEIHERPENQPSFDHDKSAEPTELDAPESCERVCEPTPCKAEFAFPCARAPTMIDG